MTTPIPAAVYGTGTGAATWHFGQAGHGRGTARSPAREARPSTNRGCEATRTGAYSPEDRGRRKKRPGPAAVPTLLDLDLGAGVLELLRDVVGLGLRHAGLDVLRGAVDEILRVLEAEAGDFTDDLDDADLVRAAALEDDGELGLLLGSGCAAASGRRSGSSSDRDRGGLDAPLVLERLRQLDQLDNGEVGQLSR